DARDLHHVVEAQLLLELRRDLFLVLDLETRLVAHRSPPHFRQMRCLPLSSIRWPIRVGPHFSQMIITLEASIGMSLSMIPPCMVCPVGLVCRLAVFTPSTRTLFLSGKTRAMRDSLPASLPAITITLSPVFSFITEPPAPARRSSWTGARAASWRRARRFGCRGAAGCCR